MAYRPRSERMRLLITLGFVVFPAAALIGFSVLHLRSIQRDRAIEAAIQRDFQHMMAITEKRMAHKAYDMVDAGPTQGALPLRFRCRPPPAGHPRATSRIRACLHLEQGKGDRRALAVALLRDAPEVQCRRRKDGHHDHRLVRHGRRQHAGENAAKWQSKGERPYYVRQPSGSTAMASRCYQSVIFFPLKENRTRELAASSSILIFCRTSSSPK